MFLDELTPVLKELTNYPIVFLGGFFSGMLRLNLADDPVKSWLDQQSGSYSNSSVAGDANNGNNKPQTIAIE